MWDNHRPPFNAFRSHPEEPFPPRWPHNFQSRMRGPTPLPFGSGAMSAGPSYGGHGGLPFGHREMSRGLDGAWEGERLSAEEHMSFSRRGRPGANIKDLADRRFTDWGLAPDMDYRARDREQRPWAAPDVDYRSEESPALGYRERLSSPSIFKDRESLEHRRQMFLELEQREIERLEMEHRQRLGTDLDFGQKEAVDMQYNLLLEAIVKRREREEFLLREREYEENLLRERETVNTMTLSDREATTVYHRESGAVDYMDGELAAQCRKSGDLDLRMNEPDKGLESLERGLEFLERLPREYSEKERTSLDYMDVEYQKDGNLKARGQEATETHYRQGKLGENQTQKPDLPKHSDADYRKKQKTDSDYRGKESSDSDYRGQEKASLEYLDMETVDSDYRGKESADSDFWERDNADADYRQSAGDGKKQNTGNIDIAKNVPSSLLDKGNKGLPLAKSAADSKTIPAKESDPVFRKVKPVVKTDKMASLSTTAKKEPQSAFTAKGEVQNKSAANTPGKLDQDFRGGANPANVNKASKERADKPSGSTGDSTGRKLCSGDQDLRSDPNRAGGDQDLRTRDYVQKKDEDLRGRETEGPEAYLSQNSQLLDFLRLAVKEFRDKGYTKSEAGEESVSEASAKPDFDIAGVSAPPQTRHPAKSFVPGGSRAAGIEFMCSEDTDYRNIEFNDVDLRLGYRQGEKRSREDAEPGSQDKDYRKVSVPEGATRIIWLDGLPTGASQEEILCSLGDVHTLAERGVNLIGYIPGYSLGSVCVEFSLVEEAVGCMEAHKGVLHFRGKKVAMKYIPNSDRWVCLQCKVINVLSKERCWQCSALRAGTDHLSLKNPHKDLAPLLTIVLPQRGKKRKGKRSPSGHSPEPRKEKTPPKERSPQVKKNKGAKQADSGSSTIIIGGISPNASPESVIKAFQPYAQLSPRSIRIMNRKNHQRGFGFIDLKNHEEAIRLTVLVRGLKPPLTIDGKVISVDLAVGPRKGGEGNRGSGRKNRKHRLLRKSFTYAGPRFSAEERPNFIYDPVTGRYVNPLVACYYNELKRDDDYPRHHSGTEGSERKSHTKRGFTEELTEEEEPAFKKPLPPPVTKEPSPEPKVNPLLGLIGAYEDDSEEEEEEEEPAVQRLPPVPKKPPPPPPPPPAVPKPAPKPTPAVPTASSSSDKMIDWKKMVCLLCRRQLPSKEALIKHQKLSDLHKQNVAIHEKMKKSRRALAYLQQREQEENQSIQRRLQQAKKELEMLEKEEEGAKQ